MEDKKTIYEDIKGHPRSFVAAYAKDWICAMIESGVQFKSIQEQKETFTGFADHIYDWVMQDMEKPMTDAQYTKIQQLLESCPNPEVKKRIEANVLSYTIGRASEVIERLIEMNTMPPEYAPNLGAGTQSYIGNAVKNRVAREP